MQNSSETPFSILVVNEIEREFFPQGPQNSMAMDTLFRERYRA
jgi:hypothetical protein